ncbi:cell wall-binding repeat-containing protein [Agrococcus sp. Ld7]|uniref:cell wall-binding repeat-containing protein n=1 Tax=Agrococcus sp. Ld7 TaxID=649148 RepID=UPI00386A3417
MQTPATVRGLLAALTTATIVASAVVAAPAPARAAAASGAAAVEACLVRSAIVPVEAEPTADGSALREAAARTLQHELLLRHPDALAGAEIARADDGAATALHVIALAGAGNAAALVPAQIEQLEAHLQTDARALEVTTSTAAGQPLTALCDAQERVMQIGGRAGDAIISVSIDHRQASLRIGLDSSTAALGPTLTRMIESLPSAVDGERAEAADDVSSVLGLADLGVPVDLVADVADEPVSRMHDADGYGGGNAIRVGGLACTTGFAVRTADRAPAVMSAGHCASPLGSNGAFVASGHAAQICGLGSGATIGRVSQNLIGAGKNVDSLLVRTAAARPTMWLGRACSGSSEVAVHGATQVAPGASVGFSGTRQGERYATRTSEPAGCYDFGFWACSTFRAMARQSVPPSSNYACLPGDSGGPTFRHRSGGGVLALGVISASGYDLGINRCSWVDMGTALHLSGATIMTHTSLTMAPPSRIAGANRYETAALVARQGYPNGAQQVYVASGELFADALSAGAAAAHVRAPLLLTTGGVLPSSTAEALRRLAPTSIVLVGGEPSVSASVEAALARIAPVTRIAGANRSATRVAGENRYATAVLVNSAFTQSRSTMYIAAGNRFPDALAASAVAGAQGAPLYLTPSSCLAPALPAEHRRLSAPRVLLLGGTPTLTQDVASYELGG